MAIDDVVLQLIDQNVPVSATTVDYLPFGIKVLKLSIQRNQNKKSDLGPIVIHPLGYQKPDVNAPQANRWRTYGTVNGDNDFWVVWGAGIEAGSPVKTKEKFPADKVILPLDDDSIYYAYLHLIHRPTAPLNHQLTNRRLTIQATDDQGNVHGQVTFDLTVPQTANNPLRSLWEWRLDDERSSIIRLGGTDNTPVDIPDYLSRWWPKPAIHYRPVDDVLNTFLSGLKIVFQRQERKNSGDFTDNGKITVLVGGETLVTVDGDIALPLHDYRLFNAELFRFTDDQNVLLRLWFYWANLKFSEEELLKFVPAGRSPQWRGEMQRVLSELAAGRLPYHKNDEIPDLERLDIIIDPKSKKAHHVGTDTHWQEFWARVKNDSVEASLASTKEIHRVVIQNKLVPTINSPITIPLQNGLCDIIREGHPKACQFRPEGKVVKVKDYDERVNYAICPRCQTRFTGQPERAVGVIGKHAPLLKNAHIIRNAVSNNVLKG